MTSLKITKPSIHNDCTCVKATAIFNVGVETCESLYTLATKEKTGHENLLRATLVFACSTIDSVGKQLVKDCLEEVINKDEGAQSVFEKYISRKIEKDPSKVLARVLSRPDYRSELIGILKESVEGESLQSYSQISELTAKFGIKTDDVISRDDAISIFGVRQELIHELDIDEAEGLQRKRVDNELKSYAEMVLNSSSKLIQETHNKIHEPRAKEAK